MTILLPADLTYSATQWAHRNRGCAQCALSN
jgi:hypothetical protein